MREYRGEVDFYAAAEKVMPHQRRFISATQRYAALVGGQYNGKSIALCLAHIKNAVRDPGGFSLIGRLHMPALINSTMRTFLELVPDDWGEWKPSEKRYIWRNGHETVFLHLDISDPKVAGHIKSMNLSAAYVDEASEVSEEVYFLIDGRVRRKGAPHHIIRVVSNPAGQDWLYRHYFDHVMRPSSWWNEHLGITARTEDNVFADPAIIAQWRNTYPPDWAARYLDGSFADFSDLVYKEFSNRTHVWDATKWQPPLEWPAIVGMDIGGGEEGDPWAIPVIAIAPDGRLYQYAEVYGSDLRIAPIAEQLHSCLEGRELEGLAYDFAQRAAARELEEYDIGGVPAEKSVKPGLFKTEQYIHIDPRLAHPFNSQVKGSPRYFVSSACPNTIREMTAYKWAKDRSGNPKFEPAHEYSHMPDGIRYAIHTFRPLPEKVESLKKWQVAGLNEQSRLYWYEASKHQHESEAETSPQLLKFTRTRHTKFVRPAILRGSGKAFGKGPSRIYPKER